MCRRKSSAAAADRLTRQGDNPGLTFFVLFVYTIVYYTSNRNIIKKINGKNNN